MVSSNDKKWLRLAIEMSEKSFNEGAFPAGAVIVKDNIEVAKDISARFPKIVFHAESNTIDASMNKLSSQLTGCVLYT